jgi:5'-deoxynucleotidase YfbR-like HD superfamily hydrolase
MTDIFNELDHRLSVVPRWSILVTIQHQSVAEHCFNVERIARRMGSAWFGLQINDLDSITQIALHHDDEESTTGDIPSPAKGKLLSERYLDSQSRMWYNADTQLRRIVKLADQMEAFWFLSMEISMGNKYVRNHRQAIGEKMFTSARDFGDETVHRLNAWVASTREMRSENYD